MGLSKNDWGRYVLPIMLMLAITFSVYSPLIGVAAWADTARAKWLVPWA